MAEGQLSFQLRSNSRAREIGLMRARRRRYCAVIDALTVRTCPRAFHLLSFHSTPSRLVLAGRALHDRSYGLAFFAAALVVVPGTSLVFAFSPLRARLARLPRPTTCTSPSLLFLPPRLHTSRKPPRTPWVGAALVHLLSKARPSVRASVHARRAVSFPSSVVVHSKERHLVRWASTSFAARRFFINARPSSHVPVREIVACQRPASVRDPRADSRSSNDD